MSKKERIERTCCFCKKKKRTTQTFEDEKNFSCSACESYMAAHFKMLMRGNIDRSLQTEYNIVMMNLDYFSKNFVERRWWMKWIWWL